DFFIAERDGALCLDGEAARLADLQRRLSLYKLRSKVTIAPAPELAVALLYGDGATARLDLPVEPGAAKAIGDTTVLVDPRPAEISRLDPQAPAAGGDRRAGAARRHAGDGRRQGGGRDAQRRRRPRPRHVAARLARRQRRAARRRGPPHAATSRLGALLRTT